VLLRLLPWALLVVWAVFLFGAFVLGSWDDTQRTRIPTWARMASSLALVGAAWSWYGLACGGAVGRFSLFVAVGMTVGFLGDLALADLLGLAEPTLVGMAAFGLGHVAYIAALVLFGNEQGLAAPAPRYGALATWLLIGSIGWAAVALPSPQPTALRMAALPYTLLLASTAGLAVGLAQQAALFIPLAIGAGLFFLSDLVVAAEMFRHMKFRGVGDVIWLTYGPGQMLIVFAVPAALRLARMLPDRP
jgi:hypothetical protein